MRRRTLSRAGLGLTLLLAAGRAGAQTVLDLPRASQHASVSQRIGLTTITIDYSRPVVNGRKIWGGLVPYGRPWRAGANENTTFETTGPVSIEGKPLPAGKYGLHAIPSEHEWTLVFSRNSTSWGSFTYDPAEDALRVLVKPAAAEMREALTYDFDALKPDSAVAALRWEKIAVPFTVAVDVDADVAESLKRQLRAWSRWGWNSWDEAATYLLDHHGKKEDALAYAHHSVEVEERFDNLMTKARALDALERRPEATAARARAFEIGSALQIHSYGRSLQAEGKQEEAFKVFRVNIKRHPDEWFVHSEIARMACADHDFGTAIKEMKLAAAGAPKDFQPQFEGLVRRLEAHEDINK